MQIVRVQNKGLITLPKSFRDELGFKINSLARVTKDRGRIILEPVRSYTDSELKTFIELDAKESKKLKREKLKE